MIDPQTGIDSSTTKTAPRSVRGSFYRLRERKFTGLLTTWEHVPGSSQWPPFGLFWSDPFEGWKRDLHLGDKKVTWKKLVHTFSDYMPRIDYQVTSTRWWQLKHFWNFHPEPWGNDPISLIFFRWVETTKQSTTILILTPSIPPNSLIPWNSWNSPLD